MSGRAQTRQKIMNTVEANGENPKYRRSVQEQNDQFLLNIPAHACKRMGLEKADELMIEIVDDGYLVYPPGEE